MMNELNECITIETKVSSQRGSGPSKWSAHQVSYLAASGGDSRGVHHVSGSGWRRGCERDYGLGSSRVCV